jgi:glutaredoxin-like protein NrdH
MLSEKMDFVKVSGKNKKHKVLLYALSTCAWCKLTKKFLKENGIEHEYVDVDLCEDEDKEKIKKDILDKGGDLAYPTIIVDGDILITGFRKDKLKEALEI